MLFLARPLDTTEQKPHEYESTPLSRQEYIAAIVHLYRGEMSRATAWRLRLDTTTNWAILTTAGLLAFSFREESNPHWALLVGLLIIALLLGIEARRYRIFDVWRSRVRKIEENFYGPILRRNPISPRPAWGERVARDLAHPTYKITYLEAMRARFLLNYWAIFALLLFSWTLKVLTFPREAHSWHEFRDNLSAGFLPWWVPLIYLGLIAAFLVLLVVAVPALPKDMDEFWSKALIEEEGDAPDL